MISILISFDWLTSLSGEDSEDFHTKFDTITWYEPLRCLYWDFEPINPDCVYAFGVDSDDINP